MAEGSTISPLPIRFSWGRIALSLAVLAAVMGYFLVHKAAFQQIGTTLTHLSLKSLALLLACAGAYVLANGAVLQQLFAAIGHRRSLGYGSALFLSMNLVNVLAPSAGFSGAVFVTQIEREKGLHGSEGVLFNFLLYLIQYSVFVAVLLAGLIFMNGQHAVSPAILGVAVFFLVFVAFFAGAGCYLLANHDLLVRVLRLPGKLMKRSPSTAKIDRMVTRLRDSWYKSHASFPCIVRAVVTALLIHGLAATVLWLCFSAISATVPLTALVAGYTVGTLLQVVSLTPAGIGFAEGGMTAVFVALGVPVEQALVVTLTYRAVIIWIPLCIGATVIHAVPAWSHSQANGVY